MIDRIGSPSLVVCLDSGCGYYERLWLTTSLRGIAGGTLTVRVLTEGVHSGDASGVVPSSFRLMRGLLSRLDVCDAHPELVRAAQNIGVAINDQCPVCGESNLRLVKYVYGDKLKQANGRAITNNAELLKLGASCDEFACYDVEVCLDCKWNHLRRQSLHGCLHAS